MCTFQKKRVKNQAYNLKTKHEKPEQALKAINEEKLWIIGPRKITKNEGVKQNYLCKFHKIANCEAKCYLLYHDDSDSVSEFKSEHLHNNHVKQSEHGISEIFKTAIDSIYDIYKKPSQVKRQLVNMYPDTPKEMFPDEQQLINYLRYKKKKAGLKSRLNLGELEKWCLENSTIPDDPDQLFVKRSIVVVQKTHKVIFNF